MKIVRRVSEMLFNPLGRYGGRELVSQRFGGNAAAYARFGIRGHNGIDLAIPERTPLRCIANTEGKVIEAAWSNVGNRCPALGKWIKIEHEPNEKFPHGYCTLYAHLEQPELNVGFDVSPGQYIGLSGNTGNSTGPHLHLGLQPLPREDNGYGGYVDFLEMISWDADPMPAYVSRYNPNRKVQGLPELKETLLGQFQEETEYGVLSKEQEEADRAQLSPSSEPEPTVETRNIYEILPEMREVVAGTRWQPYVHELTAICVIESGNRLARHNHGNLVRRFEPAQWERLWPNHSVPSGWDRLEKCYVTSWGIAQIMGWGFKAQGRSDALDFRRWLEEDGRNEIQALLNFLEAKGLYASIAAQDWETLATKYNGAGHARNNWIGKYATALAATRSQNARSESTATKLLQGALEVKPDDSASKAVAKVATSWVAKATTRGTVGLGLLAGLWQLQPVQEAILGSVDSPLVRQLIVSVVNDIVDHTEIPIVEPTATPAPVPTMETLPEPTPVPEPTAVPEPTCVDDAVEEYVWNVRVGPSEEADSVGSLSAGQIVCVYTPPNSSGWVKILSGDYSGNWVYQDAFGEIKG